MNVGILVTLLDPFRPLTAYRTLRPQVEATEEQRERIAPELLGEAIAASRAIDGAKERIDQALREADAELAALRNASADLREAQQWFQRHNLPTDYKP